MMKRMLATVLALVLVLSVIPVSMPVAAETVHETAHSCPDGDCLDQNIIWQPWTGTEKTGHYYLTADVKLSATLSLTGSNDLHLCLNGHTISGQDKTRLFSLVAGTKLSVSDCTAVLDENGKFLSGGGLVDGYHASIGGAGIYNNGGTVVLERIHMTGHSCGCTTADGWAGSAIHVRGSGTVTVKNCYFAENTGLEGAAITARQDPVITIDNTVFHKNTVTGQGGAIFVGAGNSTAGKGARVTITNSDFTENTAAKGGPAVYLKKGSSQQGSPAVTLDNCRITGNTNTTTGGNALHIAGNVVMTLKDCTVTGNLTNRTAGDAWDGALCQDNAASRFVLQGKTVIDENYVKNGAIERNVLLQFTGSKLGIDRLAPGSTVSILTKNWNEGKDFEYVSVAELLEVSADTDLTGWDPSWVYYEDNESFVFYDTVNKLLRFTKDPSHFHCLCNGQLEGCDHSKQIWIPWDSTTSLPSDSGYYFLTADVTLPTTTNVSTNDDIHLCLNGHTVTANHETEGVVQDKVFHMTRNGKLSISDCAGGGKLTGGTKGVIALSKLNDNVTENELRIYGGSIVGNSNTTDGGAITVAAGSGKVYIYGGEISGNSAAGMGGAIYAAQGSILEISGGIFKDNVAVGNGGVVAALETTLTVSAGEFTGNSGNNGGVIYGNAAKITVTNGKFANNEAKTAGGVLAVSNGCEAMLSGGEYAENTAPNGGAVCIMSKSQVTVSGGSFVRNSVTANGGALYVSYDAGLALTGGALTENTAAVHGSAVFTDRDATLTILGGQISGNSSGTTGAVSIHENIAGFTLGGKPVIENNKVGTTTENLHLRGGAVMQLQPLEAEARIGITTDNLPRFISDTAAEGDAACFLPDNNYRTVEVREGKLYMDFSGEHQHCFCAGSDQHCQHENVKWAAWEATDSLPTASGNYYLLNDVVLSQSATLRSGADVRLCLNGHTITANHATELVENDRVYILREDAKLTLSDCTARTENGKYIAGKLTGGTMGAVILHGQASATFDFYDGIIAGNNRADNVGGGVILRETKGKNVMNMYGGEISDNWAKGNGGAMYVKEGCTFNMYGGTIKNNKSTTFHGGGIAIVAGGTVNMYGGSVSGNTASKNGGGFFVQEGALQIYGGSVDGNYAGSNGGGISGINAKILLADRGSVSYNTAKAAGGALSLSTKTKLTLKGGAVDCNTAQDGGAICIMSDSVVDISGGSIGYNKALANAGGIYVSRTGILNMQGGSVHHNSCPRNGGGVFLNNAKFNFSGGDVSYNKTETTSGGILVGSSSLVEMTGGTVRGNESIRGAGCVVQGKATFNMRGGKFVANLAEIEAGGFYISTNSFFTLYDGEVCENVAAYRGGGILANASFTIAGGTVRANQVTGSDEFKSPYAGGVVIIGESEKTLTMTGGEICDNYSAGTGGGMRINYMNTLQMSGGTFRNNRAEKTAGGLEIYGAANITGGEFIENYAGTVGGGLRVVSTVHLNMENVLFKGNEAVTRGGGVYLAKGNWTTMKNCTFTENISGEQGSAIYSWDDLLIDGGSITGNTAGGAGAVYVCSANYDGQSYVLAVPKLQGDLVIDGNQGPCPGFYMEDGAVAAIGSAGLGQNAKIRVYLAAGVLTNTLFGAYDYEGGNLEYVVTAGDRSEYESEHAPIPEQPTEEPQDTAPTTEAPETEETGETDNTGLYFAIGGIGLVIVLAAVIVVVKKKK